MADWSPLDGIDHNHGESTPIIFWLLAFVVGVLALAAVVYAAVYIAAPVPRQPIDSETYFETVFPDGTPSKPQKLPCWHDAYLRELGNARDGDARKAAAVEEPDVFVSVVVPAYNEEKRLRAMVEEAVTFLEEEYPQGPRHTHLSDAKFRNPTSSKTNGSLHGHSTSLPQGWEIVIVSDGSTDKTVQIALELSREHPEGTIRVVTLLRNRGKGGAVVHGMRHVRGQYIVFADADGASKFADLRKLVEACDRAQDQRGCVVAVGSRAHLVGTDAVVKRSALRNFLMHSFHLLIRLMTPPATSHIRDTQCGFKLFSRASLPYIIPNMHSEGWIFDVEMLMLSEFAKIPVVEVPVGWKEVKGSKLNVVWDSLGMAWGLAVLRAAWTLGVYQL